MNARETKLGIIVGSVVGVLLVALAIRSIIFSPLKALDKRAVATRAAIAKAQEERRQFFLAEDKVKKYTLRAFADTVDEASAASGEVVTRQIMKCGLEESDFTRIPVGPRKLRGASEIGWNVQGQGPLTNIVSLLYSLSETPHLHHLDSLAFAAGDAPGLVRLRFRYLTLVVEPPASVVRTQLVSTASLTSPERALLNAIPDRDLLRPYLKRPPPPPPPPAGAPGQKGPGTPPPPPGAESFRVVSLSSWEGKPEVHVRDTINEKTTRYLPGDEMSGGRVVMVDYRPLPMPGRAPLLSLSRVIVQIGAEYWAIEKGQTLAEKHKLEKADLPPQLAAARPQ